MITVCESRIESEFRGWSADAVFVLEVGGTWEQAVYRYSPRTLIRPRARVLSHDGRYYLDVIGMDDPIEVRRGNQPKPKKGKTARSSLTIPRIRVPKIKGPRRKKMDWKAAFKEFVASCQPDP